MHDTRQICIIPRWPPSPSSALPGTRVRRRSTACSRTRRSSCTRWDRTRSRASRREPSTRGSAATAGAVCRGSSRTRRRSAAAPTSSFVCLPHERGGGARPADPRHRRRPLGRPSLPRAGGLRLLVRVRASSRRRAVRVVVRAPRAVRPRGPAGREPGLLRDRRPARPRSARGRDRARGRRRRGAVGDDGRRPRAPRGLARGSRSRERLAVPRRRAPARAGDRGSRSASR